MTRTTCHNGSFEQVRLEWCGSVAVISFGWQTRFLTPSLIEQTDAVFSAVLELASLIVITGLGRVFSLGADLGILDSLSEEERDRYLAAGQRLMQTVADSVVPTVAAVNGAAIGGGFELALSCDMRWCHPRAFFQLPEASLGLLPAWGAAQRLGSLVPPGVALELLCGLRIGAQTAQTFGLVSRIIIGRDFGAEVVASAVALAKVPRAALEAVKLLWLQAGAEGAGELERTLFTGLYRQRQKDSNPIKTLEIG